MKSSCDGQQRASIEEASRREEVAEQARKEAENRASFAPWNASAAFSRDLVLTNVHWRVVDPVESAMFTSYYADHQPASREGRDSPSEEEEEIDESQGVGEGEGRLSQDGRHLCEAELEEVVLDAIPRATLLLRVDERGECGYDIVNLHSRSQRGFTARQLMRAIHSFYAGELTERQMDRAMRALGEAGRTAREAYIEGKGLTRGSLLGSMVCFAGLRRVSDSVFECLLTL